MFAGQATAQAACEQPYSPETLTKDLRTVSKALSPSEPQDFQVAGAALAAGLPCVNVPLAPMILATAYRYIGLSAYLGGREDEARGWFRSGLELDSTFDWDINDISVDDPIRAVFDAERQRASSEKVPIGEHVALKVPANHRITSDGRPLSGAALTLNRPHLVQLIANNENAVVNGWLVDGNALPESLLSTALMPAAIALAPSTGAVAQRIVRSRPPLKTPSMIAGGVLMAAGVGLYATSFSTRGDFDAAVNLDSAKKHQAATNTLVISAGSAFFAGASLTYMGIMLSDGPRIGWSGRF
jgi:hypothetical protein